MEIQFQQQPKGKISKFKGRNNNNNKNNNKFVGVRQRPSGRWVAEIKDTTQKIRMWLGTFETAEAAARAYDEAACLLRGSNTRTNFVTHRVCTNSLLASRIQNLLNNKKTTEKIQKTISTTTNSSTSSPKTVTRTSTRSTSGFTSSREDIGMTTNSSITSSRETVASTSASRETIASSGETVATGSSSREIVESSTTSSRSSSDFDSCGKAYDQTQLFDDAYKPDLSNCIDEFDMNPYNTTWGFGNNSGIDRFPLAQEMLELPENVNLMSETSSSVDREFEWMKVERQISASLYAMNGVQEYMETVHDPNYEAIWDIPSYFARF